MAQSFVPGRAAKDEGENETLRGLSTTRGNLGKLGHEDGWTTFPEMLFLLGVGMLFGGALAMSAGMAAAIFIPVGLVVIAGFCGLVRYWWQATEPGRTYAVDFDGEKTASESKSNDQLVELIVDVRSKKPIVTSRNTFRLVARHLSPRWNRFWRWETASEGEAVVCYLYDAETEDYNRQQRERDKPWGTEPAHFRARDNLDGSWSAVYDLIDVAMETEFHYRVGVKMATREIWRGFLEFKATGKNGRLSTTHRGVTLWP